MSRPRRKVAEVLAMRQEFSVNDFPQWSRPQAEALFSWMHRVGYLQTTKPSMPGLHGKPTTYKVKR